jgi:hypothetical protein
MQDKVYEVQKIEIGLGRKLLGAYSVHGINLTCYSIPDLAYFFELREKDIESLLQSIDLKDYIKARFKNGSLLTYFDDQDNLVLPLFKIFEQPEYIKLVEESILMALCSVLFNLFKPDTKTIIIAGFMESIINKTHQTIYKIHEARCKGLDTSDIIGGELSRSAWEHLNSILN